MQQLRLLFFTFAFIFAFTFEAFGHARWNFPVPRDDRDGYKTGPCGTPRTVNNVTEFQAGQTITVTFEETINHPGRYLISFSQANDANFQQMAEMIDLQDGPVNRNDPNSWHQYSMDITLPTTPCDDCVLRLVQSMEENPNNPTFYYSCADIRIVAANNGGNNNNNNNNDVPPVDDPVGNQNNNGNGSNDVGNLSSGTGTETQQLPKMATGCGTITRHGGGSGTGAPLAPITMLLLALPLLLLQRLRLAVAKK